MKFDSVEFERVVERSLQDPPARWRPASHRAVHTVEAAVLVGTLAYWLYGLIGAFF